MRLVIQSNNDGEWQNDPDVSFRFAVKYTLLLGLGVLVIVYHSKLFPGVADEFVGLLKSLGVSSVLRGLNYGHLARAITGTLEGALARTPWALLTLMRSQLSSWLIAGGAVFIIVSTHKKGSSFLKNYSFGFRAYDPTRLFIRFSGSTLFLGSHFPLPIGLRSDLTGDSDISLLRRFLVSWAPMISLLLLILIDAGLCLIFRASILKDLRSSWLTAIALCSIRGLAKYRTYGT